jgi:integrase
MNIQKSQIDALVNQGQTANARARQTVFIDYRSRKAENTIKRQTRELRKFADFLGVSEDMSTNPEPWRFVTWGTVEAFLKTLLIEGYATSTINLYLSTIKRYARLALRAGTLSDSEFRAILTLEPYGKTEGANVDAKRRANDIPTRKSSEKIDPNILGPEQINEIKSLCDVSPQGRRDLIILTLLADFGLRVSEVSDLPADCFDPETGKLTVFRRKNKTETTFTLQGGTLSMFREYYNTHKPKKRFVMGSHKSGTLTGTMSRRAIQKIVRRWGESIGIDNLSPHDFRHTLATRLGKTHTARELMHVFGWKSEAMAIRYQKQPDDVKIG